MEWLADIFFTVVISRAIATRPKLSRQGQILLAQSDWRSQWMSFGFGGRRVIVDPSQMCIRIAIRRYWLFWNYRRVEFDSINEVLYGYHDLSAGWWARQQQDLFAVSLQLKNGEEILLFRFFGEGDFANDSGWPDWWYWDEIALANMTRGPQEEESLLYADTISRLVGVPVGNPTP